jgi:hypothetical protein
VPVRLDALTRTVRDQGRRDHDTIVAERLDVAIKPVSHRPGFKTDLQPVVPIRQSPDRAFDRQRTVFDIAKKSDFPLRPPSAIATACFFLATSKATKTSLCFPWSALRA